MERYVIPAKEAKEMTANGKIELFNNTMAKINIAIGKKAQEGYSTYVAMVPPIIIQKVRDVLEESGYEVYIIHNFKIEISWE